jgi:hypothetical protein
MTIADLPPAGRAPPRPAALPRTKTPVHGRRPAKVKAQAASKPKADPPPVKAAATSPVRIDTAADGSPVEAGPLNGRQVGQPRRPGLARPATGRSRTVVARLWRTAERQVREIEDRLMRLEAGEDASPRMGDATQGERDAKTLAILAKTIRDLADLSQAHARPTARPLPTGPETEDGYDPPAADLDELRRELARKLAAIQSARDADIP